MQSCLQSPSPRRLSKGSAQAEQLKAVAMRVCDKFYRQPLARLQGKSDLGDPQSAAGPSAASDLQHMPVTLPCLDYKLVWRPPADEQDVVVSIWRPVAPPGFAPLGDVCSMGKDKPVEPAMVNPDFLCGSPGHHVTPSSMHLDHRHHHL